MSSRSRLTAPRKFAIASFALLAGSLPLVAQASPAINSGASDAAVENALEGPGIVVVPNSFTVQQGQSFQYGTFSNGDLPSGPGPTIGIEGGIFFATADAGAINVLEGSTGLPNAANAVAGPNDSDSVSFQIADTLDDPQLATISPTNQFDVMSSTLQVTPSGNFIKFSFAFASEEYPEFVCTVFNDAFGFFIKPAGAPASAWQNVAIAPGTTTPVAVNSINSGSCGAAYDPVRDAGVVTDLSNSFLYVNNGEGFTPANNANLQFDGLTIPMVVDAPVTAGQTYDVKFVIADLGDSFWDSAVFLKWISSSNFANDADVELSIAADNLTPTAGTDNVTFTLTADNTGQDAAASVQVDFDLPPGFTYVSDSSGGNYNPATGVWTVGTLAATTGTSTIQVVATAGGPDGTVEAWAEVTTMAANDVDSVPSNGAAPTVAEDDEAAVALNVTATDRSDAPVSGTSYGEATHTIVTGVLIGSANDAEGATIANADATGDGADDDGVTIPTLTQGLSATIPVSVTQANGNDGYLQGWIDWNGDGDFADAGEQVATDLQSASAGTSTIDVSVTVPAAATTNQTFARFRWSTTQNLDSTTVASDGEVEDYVVTAQPAGVAVNCGIEAAGSGSGYAASGTGLYRDEIFWLDWSCGATSQFNPGDRVIKSWNVGSGLVVTATIDNITVAIEPYNTGDWVGDLLDNLYGAVNPIGLRNVVGGQDPSYDISFATTLNGNPIASDIVAAEAEDTGSSNESATWVTDGDPWQPIDVSGNLDVAFSGGGTTITMSEVADNGGGTLLALSENTNSVSVDMLAGGNEALAFGVFVPFDFGDANGFAGNGHYNGVTATGGSQPTGLTPISSLTLANVGFGGDLYLGSLAPDMEDAFQPSANANGDNTAGSNDEDGATFPALTQGQSATVSVDVNQAAGNDGYLQGWIDWNGDGDFADAGEQIATDLQSASAGASTINVPVSVPATATTSPTFARFRWSTSAGLDATTAAADGEVEDYVVSIEADNGNLGPATTSDRCVMPGLYVADGATGTWPTRDVQVGATTNMTSLATNTNRVFDNVVGELREGVEVVRWQRNGGDINLTLTFSPALPANEIALLVYDLGQGLTTPYNAQFTFSVTGDATTQDFRASAVDSETALLYGPSSGTLRKSDPSHTVSESAVLVGQNSNTVSQITLTSTGVFAGDFLGVALFAVNGCDFSDAPSGFGEPAHSVTSDLWLGAQVDDENEPMPGVGADGDDIQDLADEDAVSLPPLTQGADAIVPVRVTQATASSGYLQAWIDWDGNGDFAGPGEQIATDLQSAGAGTTIISIPVSVPAGAVTTPTFARFRWSTTAGLDTTTAAPDGEVEDYQVTIQPAANAITVTGTVFNDNGTSAHDGVLDGDEAGLGGVTVEVVNGVGDIIATTTTNGDGTYTLTIPDSAAGSPVTVRAQLPDGTYVNISGDAGALTDTDTTDGQVTFTPATGQSYPMDFGMAQLPTLTEGQSTSVAPGSSVTLAHMFTANSDLDVSFAVTNRSEAVNGSMTDVLFHDADCSGQIDGGEGVISNPYAAVAGDEICVIARITASASAPQGATLSVDLEATGTFTGTSETFTLTNTDEVTVGRQSAVVLTKEVCNVTDGGCDAASGAGFVTGNQGAPGDVLQYRLVFENRGTTSVDGFDAQDRVPAYSTLEGSSVSVVTQPSGMSCAVTDPAGGGADGYSGLLAWSCTGLLQPGEKGIFTFDVQVDQ